jgi:cytochrome d ubiquinol oxidase subunit II
MLSYIAVIWAGLIAAAVGLYVVLDGFDLGIAILFPFARSETDRDTMMSSVAPFWDGNETWLVLGGAGLWVAFPRAYAVIMPSVYLPVIVMLLALIFRGVSFEFRFVAKPQHHLWDVAFAAGSTLAAFSQGVILGTFVQGIKVENGVFAGGSLDWATPFAAVCGVGLVAGYALLGATWLIWKTEGELAETARHWAITLLVVVLAFIVVVSVWTPLGFARIAERWFSVPNVFYLTPIPIVTAALAFGAWHWLRQREEVLPFFAAIGLFVLCYLGLAISSYPYLVPPVLTIWDAAAAPESQIFSLMGVLFLLPIILGYFAFVYWTFRGKVRAGEGYH